MVNVKAGFNGNVNKVDKAGISGYEKEWRWREIKEAEGKWSWSWVWCVVQAGRSPLQC